ncbi:MAG: Hpt domain-containing protein, partial [Chloroflexota bacterium]
DYVSKPVDVAKLASVLLSWVNPQTAKNDTVATSENRDPDDTDAFPKLVQAGIIPELARSELPSTLDSINMVAALARLGSNQRLYRHLLLLFHAEYENAAQAIRAALKSDDIELARRLAHTLKGVAGTVGAEELCADVKDLEKALAEGNEPLYEMLLKLVEQRLAVVMASIATINHPVG